MFLPTDEGVEVLIETQRPAQARGHVVLVHGLEASGRAGYIRSMNAAAVAAGFAAHRFYMRSCGGTEDRCNTLYHGGLTSDLAVFLRHLADRDPGARVFLVGYSLGGNVVLKLAGEWGERAAGLVAGVVGVSAAIDLGACATRIRQRDNFVYERRFVRNMRARLIATGRYQPADLKGLHSVFEIDDRFTAPSFGFGNAVHYYKTQSAIGFLDGIRVPTLLIQAKDDTFVPFASFESEAVRRNPRIRLLATEHGGHVGFVARRTPRLWLDDTIISWIQEQSAL